MSIHEQPPGSGGPDQEEILRLRAEVARLQRERDDARKAQPRPARSHPGLGRRIVAVVLVVLTAVLAFAAVPAMYLRSEILDTDRYVATVAPLASDPAIQAEITDKVTQQISDSVDFEAITRDALNELSKTAPRVAAVITGLAPVIAEQTKNLIHSTVSKFVATPQFQDLWIQVNRVAHQGIVNLATGNTGGAVNIDQSGTVTISTKEIIARVKTALVQQGVGIAARIPDIDRQITLFQSPGTGPGHEAIRTLDATAPILAWLTVITAVGAIAVAPRGRKRSTTSGVGLAVAIAMALLALALVIGRTVLLNSIPPGSVTRRRLKTSSRHSWCRCAPACASSSWWDSSSLWPRFWAGTRVRRSLSGTAWRVRETTSPARSEQAKPNRGNTGWPATGGYWKPRLSVSLCWY